MVGSAPSAGPCVETFATAPVKAVASAAALITRSVVCMSLMVRPRFALGDELQQQAVELVGLVHLNPVAGSLDRNGDHARRDLVQRRWEIVEMSDDGADRTRVSGDGGRR